MATINYTLRIDEEDKLKAEQVFNELGMDFATGINIYIKAVYRKQRIPFELALSFEDTLRLRKASKEEKRQAANELVGCLADNNVSSDSEKDERTPS